MARVSTDYESPLVEASRSALLELALSLRAYRDSLVLVGGWAPYFLLRDHQQPDNPFVHIGSIDIDLAVDPDRIDPREYATIEELITELKKDYTIVIVTHNMQQAARVSQETGFFLHGEMIEFGPSEKLFTQPSDKRTEDYITGRFG